MRRFLMVCAVTGLALATCCVLAIAQNSSPGDSIANEQGAAGAYAKPGSSTEAIKSDKSIVVVATGIA